MQKSLSLLLCAGCLIFSACKKEQQPVAQWFRKSTLFQYEATDQSGRPVALVYLSSKRTGISEEDGQISFHESSTPQIPNAPRVFFDELEGEKRYKTRDGLNGRSQRSCGMGLLSSTFDYLEIPAHPSQGQKLPIKACDNQIVGENLIVNTDTVLTVPAGTFHTFCVVHSGSNRSYWNRDLGIIQYEVYENDSVSGLQIAITLRLQSTTDL